MAPGRSSVPTLTTENIVDEYLGVWEYYAIRNVVYLMDSTTEYLTVSNNLPICSIFSKDKQCQQLELV